MAGTLYVCATPIGNLDDMTFRVVKCLQSVDVIAAEDTRNSIKLLNHFEIKTPMTAYHEFNKYDKARALVQDMLAGKNVAIITDAGTPCVSDPGEELVRQAVEAGITVTSLPGPVAAVTALTISGLPTRRFAFEAFLPTEKANKKERQRIREEILATRLSDFHDFAPYLAAALKKAVPCVLGGADAEAVAGAIAREGDHVLGELRIKERALEAEQAAPGGAAQSRRALRALHRHRLDAA